MERQHTADIRALKQSFRAEQDSFTSGRSDHADEKRTAADDARHLRAERAMRDKAVKEAKDLKAE
eukprot:3408439-Pleurochrysis_carterae.AAC.1